MSDRVYNTVMAMDRKKCELLIEQLGVEPRYSVNVSLPDNEDTGDGELEVRSDGIAIIGIRGVLCNRASVLDQYFGITSCERLATQIDAAMSDASIRAVVYDIDSPGGQADGIDELNDAIFSYRGLKPAMAVVNGQAASAAYWLASAAGPILTSKTAAVGSIGAFIVHYDVSGMNERMGVKPTFIFAGERKVDASPYSPLSDRARADLQEQVNQVYELFVNAVARNRNLTAKTVRDTQAGVYTGRNAIPMLANRFGGLNDACEIMAAQLPAPTSYSIPPAIPAAKVRGLITGPANLHLSSDATTWLSQHSNLKPTAALAGVVERMRAELPAMRVQHGSAIEARVLAFPKARAAVASGTNRRIEMLVAPYNSLSINMGGVYERYEKGCFTTGLGLDIRALWNHNESCVLGRKSNGTCEVFDDDAGLHCIVPDAPDTTWCRDMVTSMIRGDVDQASLSFWILSARSETAGGKRVRVITSALVRDCSVCSIAAYEKTSAMVSAPASVSPSSTAQGFSLRKARAELRSLDHRLSPLERAKSEVEFLRLQ